MPGAPAHKRTEPIEAAIPVHIVATSRLNYLHRIINAETWGDLSPGSIDIQGYVTRTVIRRKEQQLRLDDVGYIIVNRHAEEDYPIHHQPAEHVHGSHVQLSLLDNGRIDISVHSRPVTVHRH